MWYFIIAFCTILWSAILIGYTVRSNREMLKRYEEGYDDGFADGYLEGNRDGKKYKRSHHLNR